MNYRHIYHAGNFADVFKHVILVALIQALLRKEKSFFYLDTHAGIGRYDLFTAEAQKSKEFQNGIIKLLKQPQIPPIVEDYLMIVKNFNQNSVSLQHYPGSPYVVRPLLRAADKMVLTELHSQDFERLRQEFFYDKQVSIHHQDGYLALKAFLPPAERRGLVLIDPPYEKTGEFKQIITALKIAFKRWETGIYAIWYPIKDKIACEQFHRALKSSNIKNILITELNIYPNDAVLRLRGCGMVIVNPPWQLDKTLEEIMPWLWSVLAVDQLGSFRVFFL